MNGDTANREVALKEEKTFGKSSRVTTAVMACTGLSRALGFVRMFAFAFFFGHGAVADVVNAVFHIPNSLRMLFAEGALSSAFIPALSTALVEQPSGERARRIVQNLFAFLLLMLIPLLLFASIFTDQVVGFLIYFNDPSKMALSAELFRFIAWYLLFISLSAVLMGALNSKRVFVIPAITPILFSVTVIGSLVLLPIRLEYRMVVGILSGGLAQVLFQLPSFVRARFDVRPDFRLHNRDFLRVLVQWLPVVVSASIFSINQLFANFFASGLEEGSVSALQYAVVYFQLPLGIFANSVITVMFPRMSRQAALSNQAGLKDTLRYGLRFIFLLLVPSSLMLIFYGRDIITLTIEHGQFTHSGTVLTASVLVGFSVGLFSTGALTLFQRLFYARKDYVRPLVSAAVILVTDVGLSLVLKETVLRVTGLALANSIAFTVGLVIFVVMARLKLGLLGLRRLIPVFFKILIGNIPLCGIIALYVLVLGPFMENQAFVLRLLVLAVVGMVSFAVTILSYLVLKIDIVEDIIKKRMLKRG